VFALLGTDTRLDMLSHGLQSETYTVERDEYLLSHHFYPTAGYWAVS